MYPTILVLSHRRSGTHLTIDTLINNLAEFEHRNGGDYFTIDHVFNKNKFSDDTEILKTLDNVVSSPNVIKSHSIYDVQRYFSSCSDIVKKRVLEIFENSHKVYVYRDGRDVMVSLYHYQKSFNEKTKNQTFSEFLRDPCGYDKHCHGNKTYSKPQFWAEHVDHWIQQSDIQIVKYDEFIEDSSVVLDKVSTAFNFELVDQLVDLTMQKNNGKIVKNNARAINKRTSVSFRGGRIGDWEETFSESDLDYFNGQINDVSPTLKNTMD